MMHDDERKAYATSIALIVTMFAMWGLAHRLYDTLLPEFARALRLDDNKVNLAQWILSFGYCLMVIPATMLMRNFGFKAGVTFGLGVFAVGMFLFYPAAEQHQYYFLLLAALTVGCGLALLEMAADPLIVTLGPVESAVRRLNLAQTLNPLGILIGLFVGRRIVQDQLHYPSSQLAHEIVKPYFLIGAAILFFALLVDYVEFPKVATERVKKDDRTLKDFALLFRHKRYSRGAAALFLCSASQVVLWGFAIAYAQSVSHSASLYSGADILLWSLIAFTAGRAVGTSLMYKFDPSLVLTAFAIAGATLVAGAAVSGNQFGKLCIVGASFCMSVFFPTIFGNAIRDLGPLNKAGSALLMCAAGCGAAALPLTNLLSRFIHIQYVMVVPSLGFFLIALFAMDFYNADKSASFSAHRATTPDRPSDTPPGDGRVGTLR